MPSTDSSPKPVDSQINGESEGDHHRPVLPVARLRRIAERARTLAGEFAAAGDRAGWLREQIRWRWFTYRHRHEAAANRAFDARYGVDTATDVPLADAGVPASEVARGNGIYRAVTESAFRAALAAVPVDPSDYTFVDVGSGKGKALLLAAEFGFRDVIGIEYAIGLHRVAERNLARWRQRSTAQASPRSVHHDALTYPLPDGPLLVFVFNALAPALMRQLVDALDRRATDRPAEPLILVYVNLRHVREIGDALAGAVSLRTRVRRRHHVVLANTAAGV